ncbi:hypothetical protein OU789_10775 [Halocynthiibacter sp. C4]|uniref:hypothetical protein n=1 Tax=Halocynthiibacter sp. C4 TaxID=2992758 RepID=UPI00237A3C14|nr:hypothetical protein [Halocynthiibacter sp. C4]MDE0590410.1 hypothetical protein [Halocynthiibacter sp. C4]
MDDLKAKVAVLEERISNLSNQLTDMKNTNKALFLVIAGVIVKLTVDFFVGGV